MFTELNLKKFLSDSLKENLTDLHLNFLDNKVLILGLNGSTYKKLAELDCPLNEEEIFLKDLQEKCSIDPKLKSPQDGKLKMIIEGKDITVMLFYIPLFMGTRVELRVIELANYQKETTRFPQEV